MSQAQLAAHIDTLVDAFARLVASARAGDTLEADRAGLDTLSAKLLLACSSLLDLTAELKHATALAAAYQLQGEAYCWKRKRSIKVGCRSAPRYWTSRRS